jgi:hypothetical protein
VNFLLRLAWKPQSSPSMFPEMLRLEV